MTTTRERLAERRAARGIDSTRLGTVTGVLSLFGAGFAWLLTIGSLAQTMATYSVLIRGKGILTVTYIAAALLIAGGVGMLLRKTWGWWTVLAGALIGFGDLFRLYGGLLSKIDPDHPRASEVWVTILTYAAVPGAIYAALTALLMVRSQRVNFRVSDEAPPRRR